MCEDKLSVVVLGVNVTGILGTFRAVLVLAVLAYALGRIWVHPSIAQEPLDSEVQYSDVLDENGVGAAPSLDFVVWLAVDEAGQERAVSGIRLTEQLVLTSSAVVEELGDVFVGSHGGDLSSGIVTGVDAGLGVALVRLAEPQSGQTAIFSDGPADTGDRVASVSLAVSREPVSVSGSISSEMQFKKARGRVKFHRHNALIGASGYGGALVNECAELVGVNVTDPLLTESGARRLNPPIETVFSVSREDVLKFLAERDIPVNISEEACLGSIERADLSEQRAEQAEVERISLVEEARRLQDEVRGVEAKLGEAEESVNILEGTLKKAQDEVERRTREAERLLRQRDATEFERNEAEIAARNARRVAEDTATELQSLVTDVGVLGHLKEQLEEDIVDTRRKMFFVIGGIVALALLCVCALVLLVFRRNARLREASGELEIAKVELSRVFPDIECRGWDGNDEAYAFIVKGAALVKSSRGVSVGRQPSSVDVVLNHPEVSRIHVRFVLKDEDLQIEDAGSTNGTFLNTKRLQADTLYSVTDGDILRLGELEMSVRLVHI